MLELDEDEVWAVVRAGGACRGTKLVGDQLAALRIARAVRRTSSSVVDQLENETRRA